MELRLEDAASMSHRERKGGRAVDQAGAAALPVPDHLELAASRANQMAASFPDSPLHPLTASSCSNLGRSPATGNTLYLPSACSTLPSFFLDPTPGPPAEHVLCAGHAALQRAAPPLHLLIQRILVGGVLAALWLARQAAEAAKCGVGHMKAEGEGDGQGAHPVWVLCHCGAKWDHEAGTHGGVVVPCMHALPALHSFIQPSLAQP